ncbi:outer membrane lipoprotein carrier protein LolA [Mesobaculum littorinae]|uniref:Outer membrane lipoprotein carrier protein LolA n=1 Tax=Mesobaculum littorinae TaxID=2486419 RepID=A0A438ADG3_9RHOB|nr:outer membrane lipoprotein carrier protein LolA [Mesobaculum littorinae]RVV96682.1 outer membrane lipoprotein carrier protein LolA [Mesobaculum littorinae]
MDRRHFLGTAAAALTAAGLAGPASAAPIPLNAISNYLNQLQTAQSQFTQINADGTISTGTLYIQRPGRMRFDYAPPEQSLVMAGGGQVAVFDNRSNSSTPEQYPLSQTPLSIILEANVDLSRRNMVVGHTQDGNKTIVVAQDPAHPEYGRIDLVFTGNPVELRQWVVTDDTGARTTVVLSDMQTGMGLSASLFSVQNEIRKRQ